MSDGTNKDREGSISKRLEILLSSMSRAQDFIASRSGQSIEDFDIEHYWSVHPDEKYDSYEFDMERVSLGRLSEDWVRLMGVVDGGNVMDVNALKSLARIIEAIAESYSRNLRARLEGDERDSR